MKSKLVKFIGYLFIVFILGCGSSGGGGGESNSDSKKLNHYRGIASLALLNPKFPTEDLFNILSNSPKPTYSFLYGTFGVNPINFLNLQAKFLDSGKNPKVLIYGLCGPCRKPRRDGKLETFYPQLDIKQLNNQLVQSEAVRNSYKKLVTHIRDTFILPFPETEFTYIPELEDNQTEESFDVLYKISLEVLGDLSNVSLMRNSNSSLGFATLRKEIHTTDKNSIDSLQPGDGVSFDGSYFTFPEEKEIPGRPNFNDIKDLIVKAEAKGVNVYLWRPEMQGLTENQPSPPPDTRTYVFTYIDRWVELLNFDSVEN
jgi:hypothetical protein